MLLDHDRLTDEDQARFLRHRNECDGITFSIARAEIGDHVIEWWRCDCCGKRFQTKKLEKEIPT